MTFACMNNKEVIIIEFDVGINYNKLRYITFLP